MPKNNIWRFINETLIHHRFVELELLSSVNKINTIYLKLDWYLEEFTCSDRRDEFNEDVIGIYTSNHVNYEREDLGELDLEQFFIYLIKESEVP